MNESTAAFRRAAHRLRQRLYVPGAGMFFVVPPVEASAPRAWRELLEDAAPHTRPDSLVWSLGAGIPRCARSDDPIVLMSFGFGTTVGLEEALEWAAPYGLMPADPYLLLALAEQQPLLRSACRFYEEQAWEVASPIRHRHEGQSEVFTVRWGAAPLTWQASLTSYSFTSGRYFGHGLALFAFRAPDA